VLGRVIHGRTTGAAAAVLLVCSPTFLYQVVQPMSDVPVLKSRVVLDFVARAS